MTVHPMTSKGGLSPVQVCSNSKITGRGTWNVYRPACGIAFGFRWATCSTIVSKNSVKG